MKKSNTGAEKITIIACKSVEKCDFFVEASKKYKTCCEFHDHAGYGELTCNNKDVKDILEKND